MLVQSSLQASNNTGMLKTCTQLWLANGIRTGDPRGFNKGCSSKFREGSCVRQTPEEGRRTYRPKRCGNNNKDEDNSPKTLNDKNMYNDHYFLYVTRVDYLANYMVPQTWIIEYLKMYRISDEFINFILEAIETWKVELSAGRQSTLRTALVQQHKVSSSTLKRAKNKNWSSQKQ